MLQKDHGHHTCESREERAVLTRGPSKARRAPLWEPVASYCLGAARLEPACTGLHLMRKAGRSVRHRTSHRVPAPGAQTRWESGHISPPTRSYGEALVPNFRFILPTPLWFYGKNSIFSHCTRRVFFFWCFSQETQILSHVNIIFHGDVLGAQHFSYLLRLIGFCKTPEYLIRGRNYLSL